MPTGSPRSLAFRLFRAVIIMILVVLLLPYLLTPIYRFVNPVSTLMLGRWVTGKRVERVWVPLSAISPVLPTPRRVRCSSSTLAARPSGRSSRAGLPAKTS